MSPNNDFDFLQAGDLKCPVESLNIKNGFMAHKPVPISIQNSWSKWVQITISISYMQGFILGYLCIRQKSV